MKRGLGKFGKRAQFFILSAVIIASIIVGMASVKNYVITGEASRRFYSSSQQLEAETGAVVDYVFYNSAEAENVTDFFTKGVDYSLGSNSKSEVFLCYLIRAGLINCQNRGSSVVQVFDNGGFESVESGDSRQLVNAGDNIRIKVGESNREYVISIRNKIVSENQFYFVFRMNSSQGEFVDVSGDMLR